jgi:geranylgeranyl pyrophosphate synthase
LASGLFLSLRMSGEEFAAQLRQVAPAIETALAEWALPTGEGVPNLDEGVRYALGLDVEDAARRGKRLRPALAVLTCEALGGLRSHVMPFAVAIEFMHNYFLVHDDIEDEDEMRHGRPTVWRRFGLAHAINIGDHLHGRAVAVLLKALDCGVAPATVLRLIALLGDTFDHTHRGQALDINARLASDLTVEQYMAMATEKTGYYLAAPMIGGAIVGGAEEPLLEDIRRYGSIVGPMYQIVDDLIDLTESKGRGERGADIREGKRSFMVAYALSHLDRAKRKELLEILDRPRGATTAEDTARAIALFEQCGAIAQAREAVKKLARRVQSTTARMPERLSRLLAGAAEFLANRTR